MQKFVYFFLFFFAFISVRGQQVLPEEALQTAEYLFPGKRSEFRIVHEEQRQGYPLYYIINHENGYAVISGNKNMPPILAYSDEGQFDSEHLIPPFMMWINHYANQIEAAYKENLVNETRQEQWEALLTKASKSRNVNEIKPFLNAQWGQGEKYNFYCPHDLNGTNGRAVTGCVATAMAQIVHYFRFPESGTGSYTYQHDTYGTISADFENAHYNYDGMRNVPEKINADISLLVHHLGVAVDMVYGANSSGMFNHKAAYALRTHFKYSPETEYLYRDSTTLDWDSVIVSHLERKIPMYYAGWSVPHTDGHGFVCDGYQVDTNSNYYYHFDFGWDGYYNGYFYTENLRPGGNNFNLAQELIVNAYPDTNLYDYPNIPTSGVRVLTSEAGSFTDGSPSFMPYAENMDYTWIIRPEMTNYNNIRFKINYQIGASDTIFISCDDDAIADRIITSDSGSLALTVDGSEITVRFSTTSEEKNRPGFHCEYQVNYNPHCSGISIFTQPQNECEDGSGDEDYRNCARCVYRIYYSPAKEITLTFDQFDTEEDEDILYIYDIRSNTPVLLETLSGELTNNTFAFQTNKLNLIFETSARETKSGWHFSYTTSEVGVEENSFENSVRIFPNPTSDVIRIEMDKEFESLQITDLTGRVIFSQSTNGKVQILDMTPYPAGLYFITFIGKEGKVTRKTVRN